MAVGTLGTWETLVVLIDSLVATYALAWVARPASECAWRLAQVVSTPVALILIGCGAVAAFSLGTTRGSLLILVMYFSLRGVKAWSDRRQGGITMVSVALVMVLLVAVGASALTAFRNAMVK